MKKILIALAILIAVVLTGCATGGRPPADDTPPHFLDLSLLPFTRNTEPLRHQWDDLMIPFPEFDFDLTNFSRVSIRARALNIDGEEITGWERMIVTLVTSTADWIEEEHAGTLHQPPSMRRDGHPNHILKEFNVDNEGAAGDVSRDRGVRVRMSQNPGGILLQNASAAVRFIELTAVVFHNNRAGFDAE